jgi:hypothetical protein
MDGVVSTPGIVARSAWKHAQAHGNMRKRMKTEGCETPQGISHPPSKTAGEFGVSKPIEALKDSLRRWWDLNQELPEKVAPMSTQVLKGWIRTAAFVSVV